MSSILVYDTIGQEVVYTAACLKEAYKVEDGSQTRIEISTLVVDAPHDFPADWHDTKRYIDGTINILKGCLKIGACIYPPAAPAIETIAGFGSLTQSLIGLVPDNRPDYEALKFKELQGSIIALEQKMRSQVSDFKSFITESEFSVDIVSEASILMKYMDDCVKYQTEETVKNFENAYCQHSPIDLAYTLMSLLEQPSTNPLVMAMNKGGNLKKTFAKWETIIKSMLGQLMFLEAFAAGLLNNKDTYSALRLLERTESTYKTIDQWRELYQKRDASYWNEVKKFVEPYLADHSDLSNKEKAQGIKDKLERYFTNDSFYIVVFDHSKSDDEHRLWSKNMIGNDQLITRTDVKGTSAFVYCSKKASDMDWDELDGMRKKVQEYKDEKYSNGNC